MGRKTSDSSIDNDEVVADQVTDGDVETGEKAPESVLDAAMRALGEGKEADKASPAGEEEVESADAEVSDEGEKVSDDVDQTAEEEAKADEELPFHKHPRFKRLIDQRNDLRTQVKATEERYEPKASAWDNMQTFVRDTGLSPEEIDKGFELMMLLRDDPTKAHDLLQPMLQRTGAFTGSSLPADLQGKVDAGTVDTDTAAELARERARASHLEERRTADAAAHTASTHRHQQDQSEQAIKHMQAEVGKWEQKWKDSDPDFEQKHTMVTDRVVALANRQGMPMTADAAIALAKQAKKDVEATLLNIMPKRQSVKTVTGGASNGSAKPRPKSALEAAKMALGS